MKKLIALCALHFALLTGANAGILIDFYAGGAAGVGENYAKGGHRENAPSYGAVAGVELPFIRAELEYSFLDGKNVELQLGMLNGYLKLAPGPIKPYFGLGIGSVLAGTNDADNVAAYQGMLGLTFGIFGIPLFVDVEGRALIAPRVYGSDYMAHYEARAKLRYKF